jgi:hypothetical protein
MTDVELTRAVERGEVANETFRHASHLHVAWVYLCESASVEQATEKMCATLRRFAASAGKPEKYHHTISLFWVQLLGGMQAVYAGECLEQIVRTHPRLLEKDLLLEYYSRETLFSDRARTSWVNPDLKPLSSDAAAIYSSGSPRNALYRVVSG